MLIKGDSMERFFVGILFILSIENMPILQNNLSSKDMNSILLMIGKEFSKRFEKDSYHIALNRFGGICEDKEQIWYKGLYQL